MDAKPEGKRPGRGDKKLMAPRVSRRKMWEAKGLQVTLPPVDDYQHIAGWFHEIGPAAAGVNGVVPVSYQEMAAWAELTGVEVTDWEAGALKRMSEQYCYQTYVSDNPECPAPYVMDVDETAMESLRKTVDVKLRSMW